MKRHGATALLTAAALICLHAGHPARAQGSGPEINLIDAGAAPRNELRYQFQEGYSGRMAMDMNISIGMSMAGQQVPATAIPTVRMIMALRTTEVAADGSARFEFETSSVEMLDGSGGDPALAGAIETALGQAGGISGWYRLDTRGRTLEAGFNLADGIDPNLSQITDSIEQSMQQMSAPLPAEPVGVGAHWQVAGTLDAGVMTLSQTADYVLTARNGDDVQMDITMTQSAPRQAMAVPGMPPEVEAMIESLESTGTGTMSVNLRTLIPTSNIAMLMNMGLSIAMGPGQQMTMNMNMENSVAIAPLGD